jgi:TP901 family phage tail tape measure protein
MALPPVFIEFIGTYAGLKAATTGVKKELAEVEAEGGTNLSRLSAVSKAALLGVGIAVVGVGVESVKMAANFQSAMSSLSTQAGLPKSQLAGLSQGVLNLAGQVGFAPDSLAEALYHIESSFASVGIKGPTAMNLLKVAAEGAAVGHANLVDVTNALDAAVASGIPGVQNFSQAMGALNSIVGSGDMEMQDLADALSTGVLAAVKGYGLSLADVGASLATFGDNNMRGQAAATNLRMAVQSLAVPAKGAAKYLKEFGWNVNTLKTDMQNNGLGKTLNDLSAKFKENGITAKTMGGVLTDMFGKKAGVGLSVLMEQLDRVNSKYPELAKGAHGFGNAVKMNQETFNQKMKDAEASIEALGVKIGTALLPSATRALGAVSGFVTFLTSHSSVLKVFGASLGAVAVGLTAASIASWSFTDSLLADPLTWIVVGIVAAVAAITLLITHFSQVKAWITGNMPGLASFFTGAWHTAMKLFSQAWDVAMKAVHGIVVWFDANVLKWIQARGNDFSKWWSKYGAQIMQIWGKVWGFVKAYAELTWKILGAGLDVLGGVFHAAWDLIVGILKLAWTIISGVVTTAIHLVMNIIGLVLDIITGKWGRVWGDLCKLVGQAFADIWHLLSGIVSTVGQTLWNVGKDIIMGIVHGIEDAGSAIFDSLKSIASSALKSVKSMLGINSPSRVFSDEVGKWIPHGIAHGIDSHASVAVSAVKRLGASLTGHISGMSGTIGGPQLGFAGAFGGGPAPVTNVVQVTVQGTVRSDRDLRDVLQQEMLRLGGRNSGTWQPYRR